MPTEIGPKKIQQAVEDGYSRMEKRRRARLLFLKQYVGHYYDAETGVIGTEPLNLIFNAIRVLESKIVYSLPTHKVETEYLAYRDYGDMLGKALHLQDRKLNIREVYRRGVVDAIFMLGILKTGLCDSGTAIHFEENDRIDPGTVYTETVDFDNFVIDPNCRNPDFSDAMFMGDRVVVDRQALLDSGLYDVEAVKRLPSANSDPDTKDRVDRMSASNINFDETEIEDRVEVWELWVPRAKAIVTVAAGKGISTDEFLRVQDYYGPDEGPYTFLRLTPPVPNNPFPISSVGIWFDLHVMANRSMRKIMDQADRQKTLVGYRRSAADDAQEALEASDGEAVAMDDPEGVKTFQFGGQEASNEAHLGQLQHWFNMMAGDPEGQAGLGGNAGSATEANIMQGNAQTSLDDMRDAVYRWASDEARKRAWYMHTDPLMEVPLIQRVSVPAEYTPGPEGPVMARPPQQQEVQVMLTPEARRGDFLDFMFSITPESMSRVDSKQRLAKAMEFAVKILPSAAQAAQVSMQMGVAFSFPKFATRMAEEAGITWMDEVFQDPEFQMQQAMQMMRGPQLEPSKGVVSAGSLSGVMQNGQSPMAGQTRDPGQQFRHDVQSGANAGQAELPIREKY